MSEPAIALVGSFEWALIQLKAGNKVGRRAFNPGGYLFLEVPNDYPFSGEISIMSYHPDVDEPREWEGAGMSCHMFQNDWEIVE